MLTSPEQLRDAIRDVTEEILRDIVPNLVREGTQKPFLTQEEVRQLTSWSNRKLQYLRETKQVEFTPLGRSYLYKTTSLLRFLEEKRIRMRGEVPAYVK